ncbi:MULTISPECIES: glycosyltransferase family 4 protein [unclassified Agarivorans]|uniref:glycosyltransferase family 4 protein n=1 Tax=unclassified Agarivorans TaxID=2636026 RepID=UPI003D7D5289
MKIVHVVSSLNMGGAERLVVNLSIEQKRLGHQVTVVSFGAKSDTYYTLLQTHGIAVQLVGGGLIARFTQSLKLLLAADAINIHSTPIVRALAPLFPMLYFKKTIFIVHGETSPKLRLFKPAILFACLFIKHVVAVSESARRSLYRRFAVNTGRVGIIENGVQLAATCKHAPTGPELPLKVGAVGRLIPLKNFELLIESVAIINQTDSSPIELHIFGDGPSLEDLKTLARDQGVTVNFHGIVLEQDEIYRHIDLLVISSNTEGLPMVLIEAMARGIPAISTRVGAIPSVIVDQQNGWLIDVGNARQLQQALAQVIHSPGCLSTVGRQAYTTVEHQFSIAAVAAKYQSLY